MRPLGTLLVASIVVGCAGPGAATVPAAPSATLALETPVLTPVPSSPAASATTAARPASSVAPSATVVLQTPVLTAAPPSPTPSATPRPAFLTLPLTDVRTGERFTLGGYPGKVTLVIAMAVW